MCQLISGRVDRKSVTETVDSGSIPVRIKPKTRKIGIRSFLFDVQQLKDNVKSPPCVVGMWAGGSLT